MKKIIIPILVIYSLHAGAQTTQATGGQTGIPVSQLPAAVSLGANDLFSIIQGGHYKKATVGLLTAQVQQGAGSGAGVIIHQDSIRVTSAQLLNALTTPVQLEPGIAGHNYQVLSIREDYTYSTAAYSGGPFLIITQDNTTTGQLFHDIGNISSTTNYSAFFSPSTNGDNHLNSVRGYPVTLYPSSALTGGDGTLDIIITYTIQ